MIQKTSIQRLAYKAGVKQLATYVYDEIRGILRADLEELLQKVLVVTENARRQTAYESDVRVALKSMGKFASFADGIEVNREVPITLPRGVTGTGTRTFHTHKKFTSHCSRMNGTRRSIQRGGGDFESDDDMDEMEDEDMELEFGSDSDDESELSSQDGGAGKRRRKKGALVERKIKFYQKQGGHCFLIPIATFNRVVNNLVLDSKQPKFHLSRDARTLIQLTVERYLISIFKSATIISRVARRSTLYSKDLQAARQIME